MGLGTALVFTLDEISRETWKTREQNTQNRVVAGFSVGSVAITGGAEGPVSSARIRGLLKTAEPTAAGAEGERRSRGGLSLLTSTLDYRGYRPGTAQNETNTAAPISAER